MNEELTRVFEKYELEAMIEYYKNNDCSRRVAIELATSLLAEMDKPKVWDGAPEWATIGRVCWTDKKHGEAYSKLYHRELPKTRIDEIIDESLDGWLFEMRMGKSEMREILKSALTEYAEEFNWEA